MRLLFALLLIPLLLSGCGGRSEAVFTWQTQNRPDNLDPQLAADDGDITAVQHLYSGLFRLDAEGLPHPDCCREYTCSGDGLRYVFHLKEGLHWLGLRGAACDTPVTADDFLFALQRVADPGTGSPYREVFGGIARVAAPDALTLQIELKKADPEFLQKLCLPGAFPCCRAFFAQSGGHYGLNGPDTLGNGPFYITGWTDYGLFLGRDAPRGQAARLRLVTDGEDATAVLSPAAPGEPAFSLCSWCIAFNRAAPPFSQVQLRQALAAVAAQSALPMPDGLIRTGRLLPASLRGGSRILPPAFGDALSLYRQGLAALELPALHGITVLLPEKAPAGLAEAFDALHQQWQRRLGLYCKVRTLPLAELQARRERGDYTLMLLPLTAPIGSPGQTLTRWCGTVNEGGALQEALLLPLFAQPQTLRLNEDWKNIRYDPYQNTLDITAAHR